MAVSVDDFGRHCWCGWGGVWGTKWVKAPDGREGPAPHPRFLAAKTHPAQMPISLRSGNPGLVAPLKNIKSAMKLERGRNLKCVRGGVVC